MTATWRVAAVLLAVLWVFVRDVPAAPRSVAGELLIGLAVGAPIAYLSRRLYGETVDLRRVVRALPDAGRYAAAFGWEVLKGNVDVAYRVLAPWMPVEPAVVVLPLRVESDLAVTTIANSITLTPGTLTLEHDEEHNALLVHAIDGRDRDAVVAPIRRWEDYALAIFDESGEPGAPPPPRPYGGDTPPGPDNGGTDDG
ncbi:MAG: Na+/H+ antiporter subunit E [Halobacteriales archaeon]